MDQNQLESMAMQFVQAYYGALSTNVESIQNFYHDQSMLTFEGDKMQGKARILEKFRSAASIAYSGEGMTVDVMPGVDQNAFIIVIVGKLFIDGDKPLNFSETFQLVRHGGGEFYVHNQIRRLVYG